MRFPARLCCTLVGAFALSGFSCGSAEEALGTEDIGPDLGVTNAVLTLDMGKVTSNLAPGGTVTKPFALCWPPTTSNMAGGPATGSFRVGPGSKSIFTSDGDLVSTIEGECRTPSGLSSATLLGSVNWDVGLVRYTLTWTSEDPHGPSVSGALEGTGYFVDDGREKSRTAEGTANWSQRCTDRVFQNSSGQVTAKIICYRFDYQPSTIDASGTVAWKIDFKP